jgi:hypothetical protein
MIRALLLSKEFYMKKFIVAGLMIASMNSYSQSYLVLNSGVTLTTDTAGFLYDFGNFRVPYKVSITGGQFLVEDEKLSTVDLNGFMYEKSEKVKKIKGKGLNYLITDSNEILTIDEAGFFYKFDKDSKTFRKAKEFGGNFFTIKPDDKKPLTDLYTVNTKGNYFKLNVEGLNPETIAVHGGTFFQTNKGVVYTVSKDGFVYPKAEIKVEAIKVSGGNFFIDATNKLYTVSEEGFLMLPVLPLNIKVTDIQKIGANYMLDSQGRIFIVDKAGNIFERTVNHDLSNTKILSF